MPAHLILLNLITQIIFGEEYSSLSSSLCSFMHSSVSLSLVGPNIRLNTPFSDTFSLRFSLYVSDQVSSLPVQILSSHGSHTAWSSGH
jgi:hypothetical protein